MPSPLFQAAGRAIQQACMAKFRQTTVGRVIGAVERITAGGRKMASIEKLAERYGRQWQSKNVLKSMIPTELGQFIGDLRKYSKSSTAGTQFLDQFLGLLGPAGKLLQGLFGASKNLGILNRDIETAAQLLEAFGWVTIPPARHKPPRGGRVRPSGVQGMIDTLESLGYRVLPPEAVPTKAPGRNIRGEPDKATWKKLWGPKAPEGKTARETKTVVIEGTRYPKTHPLVSGETVLCPASTNVYGFWYDYQNQFLYVQFLQKTPNDEDVGPGPVYRYSAVSKREFIRFYTTRGRGDGEGGQSTPGTWVWSNLRIRGTLSGHRKDYALAGIFANYVPRKATLGPEGEVFVPRMVRTKGGRYVKSALPYIVARPLSPTTRKGRK